MALAAAFCGEGEAVEVLPGNIEAWTVISMSATQWRTGIEGIATQGFAQFQTRYLGLDYNAVFKVAESFEIIPGPCLLNKVRTFEREALKLFAEAGSEKPPSCDDAQRQKCTAKYGRHLQWTCDRCERKDGRSE
jgi:hypothetical protein